MFCYMFKTIKLNVAANLNLSCNWHVINKCSSFGLNLLLFKSLYVDHDLTDFSKNENELLLISITDFLSQIYRTGIKFSRNFMRRKSFLDNNRGNVYSLSYLCFTQTDYIFKLHVKATNACLFVLTI